MSEISLLNNFFYNRFMTERLSNFCAIFRNGIKFIKKFTNIEKYSSFLFATFSHCLCYFVSEINFIAADIHKLSVEIHSRLDRTIYEAKIQKNKNRFERILIKILNICGKENGENKFSSIH